MCDVHMLSDSVQSWAELAPESSKTSADLNAHSEETKCCLTLNLIICSLAEKKA